MSFILNFPSDLSKQAGAAHGPSSSKTHSREALSRQTNLAFLVNGRRQPEEQPVTGPLLLSSSCWQNICFTQIFVRSDFQIPQKAAGHGLLASSVHCVTSFLSLWEVRDVAGRERESRRLAASLSRRNHFILIPKQHL